MKCNIIILFFYFCCIYSAVYSQEEINTDRINELEEIINNVRVDSLIYPAYASKYIPYYYEVMTVLESIPPDSMRNPEYVQKYEPYNALYVKFSYLFFESEKYSYLLDNDTIKQKKKIRRLISKISNDRYSYYDMSKANPISSYFSGTLIKELKGIQYAREIEKIVNPFFNYNSTITKNGSFFSLTKEDLEVIQRLYENWFTSYHAIKINSIIGASALDGSVYKWESPW